jgi:hypothetical protein
MAVFSLGTIEGEENNECTMSTSDCEEGKRLLKAATTPTAGSQARDAYIDHIKHCRVCNAH